MKKIFIFIFLCQLHIYSHGQNVQYNLPIRQFSMQPMVANPSLTGYQSGISLIYRNQNIYRSSNVIGDGFKSLGIVAEKAINSKLSIGIIAHQSKSTAGTSTFADSKQSSVNVNFSFSKIIKDSLTISFGSNGGFWRVNDVRLGSTANYPENPKYSRSLPILGFGVSIRNKVAYLGISIPQILNNSIYVSIDKNNFWDIKYPKTVYLNSGIIAKISRNINLRTALMFGITKGLNIQSYLNTNLIFGNNLTIGYGKMRNSLIYGIKYRNINSFNLSFSPLKRFSINYLLDSSKFIDKPILTHQISTSIKL